MEFVLVVFDQGHVVEAVFLVGVDTEEIATPGLPHGNRRLRPFREGFLGGRSLRLAVLRGVEQRLLARLGGRFCGRRVLGSRGVRSVCRRVGCGRGRRFECFGRGVPLPVRIGRGVRAEGRLRVRARCCRDSVLLPAGLLLRCCFPL